MGSSFSQKQNSYIKLVRNDDYMLKNADDIVYAIRSARRDIAYKIEEIETSELTNDEKDIECAKLIRQDQYLEALLLKDKSELAELFFSENKDTNCVFPDVLQWYTPEND
ncbi:MAG: hypothetical protein KHX03_09140 [Clostridium sp.]|nr:hypothetical protein [Clostridium sp.]